MPLQLVSTESLPSSSSAEPKKRARPYELKLLERDQLVELWPVVKPFLDAAMARACGRVTPVDYLYQAIQGACGVWVAGRPGAGIVGVGVTEVAQYPRKRILVVSVYSGLRKPIMPLWPIVEQHARELGCSEVQIPGPRAWGRIFKDYEESYTVFTKGVT